MWIERGFICEDNKPLQWDVYVLEEQDQIRYLVWEASTGRFGIPPEEFHAMVDQHRRRLKDFQSRAKVPYHRIRVHLAAVVIVSAVFPGLWLYVRLRESAELDRRRRSAWVRKGQAKFCPKCGYDMRGNPEQCSECGERLLRRLTMKPPPPSR